MQSGTMDQAEGKFLKIRSKFKEIAGELTDNPKLAAEGTDEKTAGIVQETVGQVNETLGQ